MFLGWWFSCCCCWRSCLILCFIVGCWALIFGTCFEATWDSSDPDMRKWTQTARENYVSFMLCPKTDFIWSLKAQKGGLDWWCRLLVSRCCWMRSITLSCLLILGLKRFMLCCLPVYSGHTWEFLVSKFVSLVWFVNVLRIPHKHPQDCWNH